MSIFSNVDHDHGLIRDPASKNLGNKGITVFFSMQKQHKDHKDPKKQLHCYTDYIGSFGNDPLLSLGSCEC